jgi:2-methoxy-6-polyprenyl-1,4-benzoquinol methylase
MQAFARRRLASSCRRSATPSLSRWQHSSAQTQSAQPPATEDPSSSRTTHFGYRTVPEESKESLVRGVFDSVASNYDIMNDAMSMGVHRLWKDELIGFLRPGSKGPLRCIDVAGGTGDIALRILDHARENYADRETTVDVVDINTEMLRAGHVRFKQTMYHNSPCFSAHAYHSLTDARASSPADCFP